MAQTHDFAAAITTRQGNAKLPNGRVYGFIGRDETTGAEKIYTGRAFVYQGQRLPASPLANQAYRVKSHTLAEHTQAVAAYRDWFEQQQQGPTAVNRELDRLADKLRQGHKLVLTCFCPDHLPCHARDVVMPAIVARAREPQSQSAASPDLPDSPFELLTDEGRSPVTSIATSPPSRPNIWSQSPDPLAAALTNPTEIARYWSQQGRSGITQPYPIFYDGQFWPDAEAAYQQAKPNAASATEREQVMVAILKAKLSQYPELVAGIRERGGRDWLAHCEHRVYGQSSWEGRGQDSAFLRCLIAAYDQQPDRDPSRTLTVALSGSRSRYFDAATQAATGAALAQMVAKVWERAHRCGDERLVVISGLATGVDQWGAQAVLNLKHQQGQGKLPADPAIELWAAVPCLGQEQRWPATVQQDYLRLLQQADVIRLVDPHPYRSPQQLMARNTWMLDQLTGPHDLVLAVQMQQSSGTQDLLNTAKARGIEILRFDPVQQQYYHRHPQPSPPVADYQL